MATYSAILDAEVSAEAPITVSLMTRLRDNALSYLGAPTGTRSVFNQTAAPLGWTKSSDHNDKALRVVSGDIVNGGSLAFSTVFSKTSTDPHTLTVAQMPGHAHFSVTGNQNDAHSHGPSAAVQGRRYIDPAGGAGTIIASVSGAGVGFTTVQTATFDNPITADEAEVHHHSISTEGSGTSHTHNMDIRVRYMDVIVAVKD